MEQVGTIIYDARINTSKLKTDAKEAEASAKSAADAIGNDVDAGSSKASKALERLGSVAKITTAAFGAAAVAAIGKFVIAGGISRALNIEDAQAKLKGLGHEAESVQSIMDSALAAVKGTAYGLDAAATAAATAVAAGVKPGQELTKYLSLAGDAATIAGVSFDEMSSIFGKVQTNQKAYTQELNQLADRGIPIYQWLQQELGVTADALRDMVANGEIDSATYFKVIEKNIGGAALASGATTRGAWANMQAALARVGAAIAKDIIPQVRNAFGSMTQWIDTNSDNIVSSVMGTISVFKNVVTGVCQMRTAILALVGAYVGYRAGVMAVNTVTKLQAAYNAATATSYFLLNGSLVTVRGTMNLLTLAQTALNTAMRLNPVGLLVGALVGLGTIMYGLMGQTDGTKSATDRLKTAQEGLKVASDAAKTAQDMLKGALLGQEGAALAVERAQRAYNDAVLQYGPDSLEAREAAYNLKRANDDLATSNAAVRDRTNEVSDAEKRRSDQVEAVKEASRQVAGQVGAEAKQWQGLRQSIDNAASARQKGEFKSSVPTLTGNPLNRASGGPVRANTPYFVGENSDGSLNKTSELFVPKSSGSIVNSRNLQSMLSSGGTSGIVNEIGTINISNEVDGNNWIRRLTNHDEIVSRRITPQVGK